MLEEWVNLGECHRTRGSFIIAIKWKGFELQPKPKPRVGGGVAAFHLWKLERLSCVRYASMKVVWNLCSFVLSSGFL